MNKLFILLYCLVLTEMFANVKIELKSFKANFVQKVVNEHNKSIDYKGYVYVNKNGNVLWKYTNPTAKNIYIKKDQMIIVEPALEQVIYTVLSDELNIQYLLEKAKQIDKNTFNASIYDTTYTILFKNDNLFKISYTDFIANKIIIQFNDIIHNPVFEKNFFFYVPNEEYDIIHQ